MSIARIQHAITSSNKNDVTTLAVPCNCSSIGSNDNQDCSAKVTMTTTATATTTATTTTALPVDSAKSSTILPESTKNGPPPVHVLFGLSGNHPGFLAEFNVALKGVLLNFPIHSPSLNVHLMVDDAAYQATIPLLSSSNETHLNQSSWPLPISVHLYPVQSYHEQWTKRIRQKVGRIFTKKHTIGTYYRLFAHEILAPDVGPVLYMDTDVLIVASLDDLWKNIDTKLMYQWTGTKGRIAGFMVLNLDLFRKWDFWKMVGDMNQNFTKRDADQGILRAVQDFNPHCCGWIAEEAWGLHKELIWSHLKKGSTLDYFVSQVPRAAMFHLNGGGESKESYFEDLPKEHFGIVQYYVELRWPWVLYFGESRTGPLGGYPLQIVDHVLQP